MPTYTYPYDPTGLLPSNRIVNEIFTVQPRLNPEDALFIVPRATPFFKYSLIVRTGVNEGSPTLVEGVDYILTHHFVEATEALNVPIYGSIMFLNPLYTGVVYVTYQTLGGAYTLDDYSIVEDITRRYHNILFVTFTEIAGLPVSFPPDGHAHNPNDLTGMGDVVNALTSLAFTLQTPANPLPAPNHGHTPPQVGLGNLQNYPLATLQDVLDGVGGRYVTATTVKAAIMALSRVGDYDQSFFAAQQQLNTLAQQLAAAQAARVQGDLYNANALQDYINAQGSKYPRTIAAGIFTHGNPHVMLSASPGWYPGSDRKIVNASGINVTNVRYAVIITPENGGDGGWHIDRFNNGFSVNIQDRSGTNRVGYTGRVNWQLVEVVGSSASEGNGTYGPGGYHFAIYPGSPKRVRLYAAGGGGGFSTRSGAETQAAWSGGDTVFWTDDNNEINFTAKGGLAGTDGHWANGSAYNDGTGGAGGLGFTSPPLLIPASTSAVTVNAGLPGNNSVFDHLGGNSGRFANRGAGGNGADGVGDNGYAFGGGGGEGGFIDFIVSNNTSDPIGVNLLVGFAGRGGTTSNGNAGVDGAQGLAIIEDA